MAEPMKSRFAIDLDDLERQLRDTAATQPKAQPADPLAELARIVGQDDPFKALFADKAARPAPAFGQPQGQVSHPVAHQAPQAPQPAMPPAMPAVAAPDAAPTPPAPAQTMRGEPSIDDLLRDFDLAMEKADAAVQKAPAAAAAMSPPQPQPASAAPMRTNGEADPMVDAFDALLRDELRGPVEPAMARNGAARSPAAFDMDDRDRPDPEVTPARPRDLDGAAVGRHGFDEPREFADDLPPPDYPEPPAGPVDDMRPLEPQQPRKGLMIAAGMMGVAAIGIAAVVGLGGLFGGGSNTTSGGDVPVVRAEGGPAKVQPANPGGVDIPNQNKQIFERAGEPRPADTRVVNREEQPMDVQAAARQAARVILPAPGGEPAAGTPMGGTGAAGAAPVPAGTPIAPGIVAAPPAAPGAAAVPPQATIQPAQPPALGEPRRVRTVSVRPDGTIAPPPGTPEAGNGTAAAPAQPAAPLRPAQSAQQPTTTGSAPVVRAPTPPRPPAEPPRQQVAAAPPTAPVAPPRAAEPAAAPAPARTGNWMVQLAAPGSEAEARATFATLQRRHAGQLAGESPVVRRAEANGRTVYRLRVGPYGSRDEAISKCEAIKADGGACFVASN